MVNKLFKHELNSYLRVVLPMHMVLIGVALLGRFVQLFDNDSTAYNIVFWSSVVVFCVGVVACILLTLVFGIRRFYTNLFTSEGYLSFTLPVTSTQHILVKNIVAVVSQVASLIMILFATCVITLGDVCVELFKAGGYLLKFFYREFDYHTILYIVEFIIALFVALCATYMLYYACIALGQRAKKNRVAAAVGVFFIYYLIMQVLATVFIIIVSVFYEQLHIEQILEYLETHPIFTVHLALCGTIVVDSLLWLLYYAITKSTIKNKLNLE